MHRILLSLLILGCVIYLTACNSLGFLPSTPSPAEREAEECAVDITILEGSKERCMHNLTVASSTEPGPCQLGSESFPDLDAELIEDYNQILQESVPLNPDLLFWENLGDSIW